MQAGAGAAQEPEEEAGEGLLLQGEVAEAQSFFRMP